MMSGSMPCASKRAQHADMGKAARAAAAEREPDGRAHRCALGRFGCRFGAAVAVSPAALDPRKPNVLSVGRDDHAATAAIQGGRAVMVKSLPECRVANAAVQRAREFIKL